MNARECPVKAKDKQALVIGYYRTFSHYCKSNLQRVHTVISSCTMSITLPHPAVEAESVNPGLVSSDSSSATGVGLFLGGAVAGVIGVLLIEGIAGGAFWLRQRKHK